MGLAVLITITLLCIGWSLWIRRVTWNCRWEVAATLNIALQGATVVLMSPLASETLGHWLHSLTGMWNLEDCLKARSPSPPAARSDDRLALSTTARISLRDWTRGWRRSEQGRSGPGEVAELLLAKSLGILVIDDPHPDPGITEAACRRRVPTCCRAASPQVESPAGKRCFALSARYRDNP